MLRNKWNAFWFRSHSIDLGMWLSEARAATEKDREKYLSRAIASQAKANKHLLQATPAQDDMVTFMLHTQELNKLCSTEL